MGDLNTFGEKSTRRSRIAQVMRLAANKCHLLFVVEEAKRERLPEEFVTDAVIRLRNIETHGYLRRTVEIEKTRGQTHVRGQHPFVTRAGDGSTTGKKFFENYDDPLVRKKDGRFRPGDLVDPAGLAAKLQDKRNLVSTHLYGQFNRDTRQLLDEYDASAPRLEALRSALAAEFNRRLDDPSLFDERRFEGVKLSDKTRGLLALKPKGEEIASLNRLLLEEAYPREIGHDKQSYVQFFPSINYLSRELMKDREEPRKSPPEDKFAGFGIPYLDTMLGGDGELSSENGTDKRGLPCSTVTALIGDALTKKDQLSHAFLSRTFFPFAQTLADRVKCLKYASKREAINKCKRDVEEAAKELEAEILEGPKAESGVALMMTNRDTHSEELAADFVKWLNPVSLLGGDAPYEAVEHFRKVLREHIERYTICRRMEIHDLSSPIVAHIFQRNIEAAQKKLFPNEPVLPEIGKRFDESWRIRL
ncbi:MAG TPA: ATPase domain-containing protein, partial [Pyrinomonadaceae bacterium]|nr:ATPase domain-containing protein [Pyrinomonadaceae bacterium]